MHPCPATCCRLRTPTSCCLLHWSFEAAGNTHLLIKPSVPPTWPPHLYGNCPAMCWTTLPHPCHSPCLPTTCHHPPRHRLRHPGTPAGVSCLVPTPLPSGQPSPPIFPALGSAAVQPITALLSTATASARLQQHTAFLRLAAPPEPIRQALLPFLQALSRAWRLPCDNNLKKPLGRLVVNAIPGGRLPRWVCPCSLCTVMNQAIGAHSGCEAVVYSRCYATPAVALSLPHAGHTLTHRTTCTPPQFQAATIAGCTLSGTALWQ
jgi:hypothetical protein